MSRQFSQNRILRRLLQVDRPVDPLTEAELTAERERNYRWNFGVNMMDVVAFWFGLSAIGTLVFGRRSWRRRRLDPRIAFFVLPLAYFVSYLPVFTTGDFRYMYPATLVAQVLGISWVASSLARLVGRPSAAADLEAQ